MFFSGFRIYEFTNFLQFLDETKLGKLAIKPHIAALGLRPKMFIWSEEMGLRVRPPPSLRNYGPKDPSDTSPFDGSTPLPKNNVDYIAEKPFFSEYVVVSMGAHCLSTVCLTEKIKWLRTPSLNRLP